MVGLSPEESDSRDLTRLGNFWTFFDQFLSILPETEIFCFFPRESEIRIPDPTLMEILPSIVQSDYRWINVTQVAPFYIGHLS